MKNSSYSNNIIKSDYVKVKGTVSLNYFNFKEKEELPVNEEVENHNEKRLELLRLEEKINQKLIDAQIKYDEILNQANTESEKILAETNQKAVEIEKRAYHEGYEQGTQNGYEDGGISFERMYGRMYDKYILEHAKTRVLRAVIQRNE